MHSHILPGLDDGARTLEETLELVRGVHSLGFTEIVVTPHFYPGRYTPSAQQIDEALSTVRGAIQSQSIPITLIRGRECFLDYELLTAPDRETFSFDISGKKFQLIELPQITTPQAISGYLRTLESAGVTPILAHAERYNRIIRDPERIDEMQQLGFMIQIDLASFAPSAHKAIRKAATKLLEMGVVQLLASDVHRPHQLENVEAGLKEVRKILGETDANRLFQLP